MNKTGIHHLALAGLVAGIDTFLSEEKLDILIEEGPLFFKNSLSILPDKEQEKSSI